MKNHDFDLKWHNFWHNFARSCRRFRQTFSSRCTRCIDIQRVCVGGTSSPPLRLGALCTYASCTGWLMIQFSASHARCHHACLHINYDQNVQCAAGWCIRTFSAVTPRRRGRCLVTYYVYVVRAFIPWDLLLHRLVAFHRVLFCALTHSHLSRPAWA